MSPDEEQAPEEMHDLWYHAVSRIHQGYHTQVIAVYGYCPVFALYCTCENDREEFFEGDAFLLELHPLRWVRVGPLQLEPFLR